jgi:hypothetical protein
MARQLELTDGEVGCSKLGRTLDLRPQKIRYLNCRM